MTAATSARRSKTEAGVFGRASTAFTERNKQELSSGTTRTAMVRRGVERSNGGGAAADGLDGVAAAGLDGVASDGRAAGVLDTVEGVTTSTSPFRNKVDTCWLSGAVTGRGGKPARTALMVAVMVTERNRRDG